MVVTRPDWLKIKCPDANKMHHIKGLMDKLKLHTVCESAQCPNAGECFGNSTATFMIMGDVCTRNCAFCAVNHGSPEVIDHSEPENLANAVSVLGLKHVVITSVTRDDLADGGANHFAAVVQAVRQKKPDVSIELLIPDMGGDAAALTVIAKASPDVLNHNMETVPSLYGKVRPQANYQRSIDLFKFVKSVNPKLITKSGMMLGLGEKAEDVIGVMRDLHNAGCNILTLGQYLRPSSEHIPMERYITPEEFEKYRQEGLAIGFRAVVANPLVRSSYYAREAYREALAAY